MLHKILILNGPNLNMLGRREPEVYGRDTLDDVRAACEGRARKLKQTIDFRQSNHEGELVDWIQQASDDGASAIILNAGAYTHTSIALLDALRAVDIPVVEVHLSNIHAREPFRSRSYVASAAQGMICGFGPRGYLLALDALAGMLKEG